MVFSSDKENDAFMASDEVEPAWANAYKLARHGAEKADIWRYAVIHKYGGVYMDSDMTAQKPLWTIIDKKADFAQQFLKKGTGREGTQFVLMYTPKHPIMKAVLDIIGEKFQSGVGNVPTNKVTGPGALAQAFAATNAFGLVMCKDQVHVCGDVNYTETSEFGKGQFFVGSNSAKHTNDLDTGARWHMADPCAKAESRSEGLFTPWENMHHF
jgi:hypothetical protein